MRYIHFLLILTPILCQDAPQRCIGDDLYVPLAVRRSFDDSQSECESLGGSLTTVASLEEFNFLNSFIENFNLRSPWVGIHNFLRPNTQNRLEDFKFIIDESSLPSDFHGDGEPNTPPWFTGSNELLQFGRAGNNCVHMARFSGRNEVTVIDALNDLDCDKELHAICKVPSGCFESQTCQENDLIATFSSVSLSQPIDTSFICNQVGGVFDSQTLDSFDCLTTDGCLLNTVLDQNNHPSCFQDDLFFVQQNTGTKENNEDFCRNGVEDGVLSKVESEDQLNFLASVVEPFRNEENVFDSFYLGISTPIEGGSENASDFFFDDGSTENLDFIQDKDTGELPWRVGEPNKGSTFSLIEECVALAIPDPGLIDIGCEQSLRGVCQAEDACPFSSCLENDLFLFVDQELNFRAAQEFCVDVFGGNLARIANEEEHDFVIQLVKQSGVQIDNGVWIGVELGSTDTDSTDASNFVFVDPGNEDNSFINIGQGNFPWDATFNEPSSEDENCVEILGTLDFWNDLNCANFNRFVCRVDGSSACSVVIFPTPPPSMPPATDPVQTPSATDPVPSTAPNVNDVDNPPDEDDDDSTVNDAAELAINFVFATISGTAFLALIFFTLFFLKTRAQLKQLKLSHAAVKEEIEKSTA